MSKTSAMGERALTETTNGGGDCAVDAYEPELHQSDASLDHVERARRQ